MIGLTALACAAEQSGEDAGSVRADAGWDAGRDAGVDAGAGSDAGRDAGTDAGDDPCPPPDAPGTWEMLPDLGVLPGDTPTGAAEIVVVGDTALASFVEPHAEPTRGLGVQTQRWTGVEWEALGAANSIAMGADYNDVALDGLGRPVLVWQEATDGEWDLYVRRFEAGAWTDVGSPIGVGEGQDETPSITATAERGPFVAWKRGGRVASDEILVAEWNGTEWETLGEPIVASEGFDTIAAFPQVEASDRAPYLSWLEQDSATGAARYHVATLVDDAWTEVGEPADAPWGARHRLTVDANGLPVIVVMMDDFNVQVRRWDGSAWRALPSAGEGLTGVDSINQPAVAVDHLDRPLVAFWARGVGGAIFVRRFESGVWTTLGTHGGMPTTDNPVSNPRLAVGRCGEPWVTWSAESGGSGHPHVAVYLD